MKKKLIFIMPLIVAVVVSLLSFSKYHQNSMLRIYDLFLRIKPTLEEEKQILLIDVDDLAISEVGVWPWSRSIMADGLILLKEFGAKYAIFDIEYTEESPRGINPDVLNNKIPETVEYNFEIINTNTTDLLSSISAGNIPVADADDFATQLEGINSKIKGDILAAVKTISRDNDEYLGKTGRYFGNAFFTLNMFKGNDDSTSQELKDWVLENSAITNISIDKDIVNGQLKNGKEWVYITDDIRPTIMPIISNGKGAGFPNVVIDNDGVRRRIDLLRYYNGKYFPQLAFAPLYDWLGQPKIEANKNNLLLKGAVMPNGDVKDIDIPLMNGHLIINWPAKPFIESFRHMTYWYLIMHNTLYDNLINNLRTMRDVGFLDYYSGNTPFYELHQYSYSLLENMIKTGNTKDFKEYINVRNYFLGEIGIFLSGSAKDQILADVEAVLAAPDSEVSQDIKISYTDLKGTVPIFFEESLKIFNDLTEVRKILVENLEGSFCIIGNTGTSTTDIGVNPFEKEYVNVGTHAAIANTILSGSFLRFAPRWIPILISFIFSYLVFFCIKNSSTSISIVIGFAFIAAIIAIATAVFRFTGIYYDIILPVTSVFVTFIIYTMVNLITTSKDKAFIQSAFGRYLSQDVISQLMDNPEKLNLGGDKKELTAIFTDVRGFSTISEKLDPIDLVKLLNEYLTGMSDIILDQRGTIDKYEGDAIISFFGAPIDFSEHAERACTASILMKKKEIELNKFFHEKGMTPEPLLTRVGINTGDMVVGNMGTARKMDYTIMGNAVNLAARLEGVNKQYGTWVLASEYTINKTGDLFACRKLDRVRVVGINTPVQLYELIDEKKEATDKVLEIIDLSHKALDKFLNKDWVGCTGLFGKVLSIYPEDGPASIYIKRCEDFKINKPSENWDGVFNLTSK